MDKKLSPDRGVALATLHSLLKNYYQLPIQDFVDLLKGLVSKKEPLLAYKPPPGVWPKIKELHIENFKTINKAKISLGQVTILVGPNGSGKSSVLQATHWAARAASYITPKNTKEVISFERLDYLPSSQPLSTGYFGELGSGGNQPHTLVSFVHHTPSNTAPFLATVKIWAARNRGAISAHIEGGGAVTPFKQRSQPITAYIPGLAGLSEKETILAQPLMRRHAASGDAGGVLRNVLYNLATTQTEEKAGSGLARLSKLNEYLYAIHPGYLVEVSFDEREDIHINATYSQAAKNSEGVIVPLSASRPLENLATGILQVVQIFAYLVLFRPRLLLVDEPDAHLHPDKQERLIETLEKAALDVGTQVVITTHSQHVVRGASQSTQLIWMDGGEVVSGNEKSIRTLMGWGALDKKAIFFVEDKEDQAVRSILRQWPELNRQLSICKCYGVDNLPRHPLIEGLLEEGEIQLKVLIHRDRDFMSEVEGDMWAGQYKNTFPWITKYVDVEAYFCQPEYLSALYGVPLAVSSAWVVSAANNVSQALETFKNKRNTINRLLYPDGGTPNSVELWKKHGEKGPSTVLGKSLHKALKPIVKAAGHDSHRLHAFEIPQGFEVAPDLRNVVETALSSR